MLTMQSDILKIASFVKPTVKNPKDFDSLFYELDTYFTTLCIHYVFNMFFIIVLDLWQLQQILFGYKLYKKDLL